MAVQTSSTSIHPVKKYDVFLSFRGADTRTNFTDHLYNALQVRQGIPTFRDSEQLEKGQDLSQLFEAIEKSTIAVVILSSSYASSTWCFREVAKIVECRNKSGLIVLPVFYDIEPTQVRDQTGNFQNYFDQHEQKFKDSIGKVKIWRQALTEVADLSGWDLKHRFETTVIDEIVKCVDENWKLKFNLPYSNEDSKDFVGMDPVREIELDLDIKGLDKIGVIGICGMPGVGKTRIARVVFRRNWHHFEANCFIANVGETRKKNGLLHIQNQLYHDLLDSKVITMNDVPAERRKLSHKKVLIILDGVTELEFVLELVGTGGEELINWFGRGSRIIITTIDEKLLKDYEAKIHKIDRLTENESRRLFFRKAFKKDHPLHDYAELDFKSKIDHPMCQYTDLSYKFVDLADGLPLAIVALGNLLLNGTLDQWKAELGILEANNYTDDEKTYGILKVCIDGLRDGAKEIFLDIACFFKGDDKRRAERIFESCGHNPVMNLDILLKKSLVTIVGGKLWMHDLLQETGQKMVIGESKSLGKRSRLWNHMEAISVFKQDKGTSAVRGVFLSSPRPGIVQLKADSFSKIDFLRLLKIKNVKFSGCLEYDLSNELRLLEWHSFPSTSLPSNFEPEKLVELHLPQSQIKQLWEGITTPPLEKLVIMDLSDCIYLTSTPDLQSVPNLESLILKGCTRLSDVHLPIGDHLQKLILLNLEGCECLSSLPDGICSLRSLITLILSGCSNLANLPEKIGENMKQLSQLDLEGTTIKELPASIKNLTGLIRLNLRDCKNLSSLPDIICSLTKLQFLNLSGCLKLDELPENLGSLVGLKELDASRCCIRQVPSSILLLKDLESLSFHGCGGLQLPASFSELVSLTKLDLGYCRLSYGAIPADLDCLSSLNHLNLSGNSLVRVPESIINLSKLEVLLLDDCSWLRSLPDLPSSIQCVSARNCRLLGTYPNSYFSSWETSSSYLGQLESPSPVYSQSSSFNGPQHCQSMQIVPFQNKGSLKVLLLHGNLDIWVYEAKNLPNMDMFHRTLGGMLMKFPGTGSNKANGQSNRGITSDPYVSISVANAVIGRTYVISNSEFPVWTQHFNVPVAHYAAEVHFVVKDSNLVGSQLIGVVAVPVQHIYLGARVEGTFPIRNASGKPCKPGAVLRLSIQYTPIERLSSYHNGVGAGPDYYGVPGTYFPLRTGGKVTLYQDALVPDGCLPNLVLDLGMPYVHGKCWNDIFDAIHQARHMVYIAGWSVWHNVRLVRDGGGASNLTIGDLLMSKSQEGVRVLLLVWDDPTSRSILGHKTDGMQIHDEEIRRYFKHSSVQVLLCPRTAGKRHSWFTRREVGTIYAHNQKTVIVDAEAGHNMRKIVSFVGGLDLCDGRYDTPNHDLFGTLKTVHEDDFHNPTYTGSTAGCPREPWHDLHCRVDGPAAYDVLTNFEERWLKASKPQGMKKLNKSINDSLLKLERIPDIIGASRAASTSDNDPETWHVQIFRSIDSNSVKGFPKDPKEATSKNLVCGKNVLIDMSIHSAYVKAIRSAQHFIYIENQYFIGSSYNWSQYKDLGANNLIPMEIALKIAEKIKANQRFVVYIVIPMWPEGVPTGAATQRILFWQNKTMQMMYETIYKALVETGLEGSFSPLDYLNFFCLGKREAVDGNETSVSAANTPQALGQKSRRFMIYVHSKGMIVDDEYVIVGSANINQRSMEGTRDTEIAIGSYQPHHTWASSYSSPRGQIFGYRMSLWAEHTGTIEDCFTQPESLDCVRRVRSLGEMNWKQFAAEDVTEMKGHLLKYPVEVDRKGKVTSLPGYENFLDVGGNITGSFLGIQENLTI